MIEIDKGDLEKINQVLDNLNDEQQQYMKTKLDPKILSELNNVFSTQEVKHIVDIVAHFNTSKDFSYEELADLEDVFGKVQDTLYYMKERVELDVFFKDGYALDMDKIKEKFKKKRLHKRFPNFNFKRLEELYKNPPATMKCYYSEEEMKFDSYIFRKYMIGIIQMVLDHMDLVVAIHGGEGSGKSTHASQLMYMVWYIITEVGIVDYKFDIKEMFFNSLESLRLKEDDYFDQPFRIFTLDEGNELHRQNWRDEEVSTFFQRLRRERFNQRIKFICIPVLGELMTNIVLSRVNFIVEMKNTNDVKSGSLNKGRVLFSIIPRGDKVYSPLQKMDLTRDMVKNVLAESLKDKNYLAGMPREIVVKQYDVNGVWAFPEELYVKELKETNKSFKVSGGLKLTDLEAFYMYMSRISLKAIGLESKDVKYSTMNKFFNRLKRYFEESPDRFNKFEKILQRKEEEKNIKSMS